MIPEKEMEMVFDEEALLDRLMGDRDLAREVLHAFLVDLPRQMEVLRGALGRSDAEAVRQQAHTLKGASANIGASILNDISLRMEIEANIGADLEKMTQLLKELETACGEFKTTLLRSGWVDKSG